MGNAVLTWVSFGIAVLGAALGLTNLFIDIRRHRPCVKVSARWIYVYFGGGDFAWGLAVKIMNVGLTDVTIRQIGVETDGGFIGVKPITIKGWSEPDLIKPGDAAVVRIPRETFRRCPAEKVGRLFVELPSEQKFYAGIVRDYIAAFHASPDNDFEEASFEPLFTILAPPNVSEKQRQQIEENAGHYCCMN